MPVTWAGIFGQKIGQSKIDWLNLVAQLYRPRDGIWIGGKEMKGGKREYDNGPLPYIHPEE